MNVSALIERLFPSRESGPPETPWLVVGIGNPGPEYRNTRHNVGWWCIDLLLERTGGSLDRKDRRVMKAEVSMQSRQAVLAKPRTYVNKSGEAVEYLFSRYGGRPDRLIVVLDDINLEPGVLRIRRKGGAGGHNGLKSIINSIGSEEFCRVRIGVGRPADRGPGQIDHVLGTFKPDELKAVKSAVVRAADAVEAVVASGVDEAMNMFNMPPSEQSG